MSLSSPSSSLSPFPSFSLISDFLPSPHHHYHHPFFLLSLSFQTSFLLLFLIIIIIIFRFSFFLFHLRFLSSSSSSSTSSPLPLSPQTSLLLLFLFLLSLFLFLMSLPTPLPHQTAPSLSSNTESSPEFINVARNRRRDLARHWHCAGALSCRRASRLAPDLPPLAHLLFKRHEARQCHVCV